jgi:cytoskeletal protein RodZ
MNGSIRLAVLAALLASGPALAQDPYPPTEQQPAPTEQTPSATEQTPSATEQMPSATEQMPSATDHTQATDPSTQTTDQWPEFSALDKNGDGSISRDEAREQSLVASRFGVMDGDGDGALSSDEYQKGRDQSKAPNP